MASNDKEDKDLEDYVDVDKSNRSNNLEPIHPPQTCPSCANQVYQITGGVGWRCYNLQCPAQQVERILHFVSRKAMDIDTIGPALIQ